MVKYYGSNYQLLQFTDGELGENELDGMMIRLLSGASLDVQHPHRPSGFFYAGETPAGHSHWLDLWRKSEELQDYMPLRAVKKPPCLLLIHPEEDLGVEVQWSLEQGELPRILGIYRGRDLDRRRARGGCWIEENGSLAVKLSQQNPDLSGLSPFLWVELSLIMMAVMNQI